MRVDLNADVGEFDDPNALGQEPALMRLITSANVACGGHVGTDASMAATVALALAHGVAIGAHPSLDDREGFGRRELPVTPDDVHALVRRQVVRLTEVAAAQGGRLRHVKPHGALYNMAARERRVADAVAHAVATCDPRLVLVGLSGSALIDAGRHAGLRTASEAFPDRAYAADGSLAGRGTPGALVQAPDVAAARAVRMVVEQAVEALDGSRIAILADTLCVHGDTPGAVTIAEAVRHALERAGVAVRAL